VSEDYEKYLPSTEEIKQRAAFALEYWKVRNEVIKRTRDSLDGNNPIQIPTSTQYKPVAVHTYFLASVLNEKTARFLSIPIPQVVVEDTLDDEEWQKASELEKALSIAAYEMERKGDGDVWSRVISDAILIDEGVEKIQLAPQAFWAELPEYDEGSVKYPFMSDERELYKKERGIPIRSLYVPLESVYPIYDGPTATDCFEFEIRSLAACKRNKLYNQASLADYENEGGNKGPHGVKVAIMHWSDQMYGADYALVQGSAESNAMGANPNSFKVDMDGVSSISEIRLLYCYKHGLGEVPYNFVGGRHGGWKTQSNRIESVNKGFLELNQAGDELLSQTLTNIRATFWPSLKYEVDPEMRGFDPGATPPKPPGINEGEEITIFKGESLEPLFTAQSNPTVPWAMEQIKDQLNRLGGSTVLFGQHQPGVDTGYHNAQQVSQAEHLDEKIEQHIAQGAVRHFTMILKYIRSLDEKAYVHYSEDHGEKRRNGRYISIDPKSLYPLPRLDVAVRRPSSIDYITNIRAAREATDDRNGRGPLMSDSMARGKFLNIEYPDVEKRAIVIETEERKLLEAGVITEKITEAINIKLAQKGVPDISADALANVDPALLQSLQQLEMGNAAQQGGLDPAHLAAVAGQGLAIPGGTPTQAPMGPQGNNPLDRTGGNPGPDPQMGARVGEAVAGAMGAR